jgi:hypothetical protein
MSSTLMRLDRERLVIVMSSPQFVKPLMSRFKLVAEFGATKLLMRSLMRELRVSCLEPLLWKILISSDDLPRAMP